MRLHGNTSAELRQHFLDWWFAPMVAAVYRRLPDAHAVVLAVAQYYCDEAADAVHPMIWPVLVDPVWPPAESDDAWTYRHGHHHDELVSDVWGRRRDYYGDNYDLVVAFAAYCKPGGNQDMDGEAAYTPYAIHWRNRTTPLEIVGVMHQPQWEDRFDLPQHAGRWPTTRRTPLQGRALTGHPVDLTDLLAARSAPRHLDDGLRAARRLLAALEDDGRGLEDLADADRDVEQWLEAIEKASVQ